MTNPSTSADPATAIHDDIAIVLIGIAAWINRDLQRVVDWLDAQLETCSASYQRSHA